MIDIKLLRDTPERVKEALKKRGVKLDVDKLLELDKRKKELLQEVERLRAQRNKISSQKGKPEFLEEAREIKANIKKAEEKLRQLETEFNKLFILIPNIPFDDVPVGEDEKDNIVIGKWGTPKRFDFPVKDHVEIGKDLDLIDIERAAKISGSRFGILKNEAALLEFALIRLALDILLKQGFVPIIPPALVKPEAMKNMGYIDTENDLAERYFLKRDKLFLVGTAEQAVGPMHQGEIFQDQELPKRYVAFSSCFREEAGSYGKDTRGIFRVHQFDKIEMFSFTKPEDSREEHKHLIALEKELVQKLGIPYRLVHLSTGDMARPSASTFDTEAWFPSQARYREIQSASNCTDFQARRLNIRYKTKDNEIKFVHMLNATAFAIGRTIIAILENYQQKDGRILIPKALRKYLGFKYISS